jgi:acetyl esterase/lipase
MVRYVLTVFSALLSACVLHQGHQVTSETRPLVTYGVSITRNVRYTPPNWPQPLVADLYQPRVAESSPAVVMVHGGGWNGRTRDDMNSMAKAVARRGYVVMNVSYRLAPRWTFPAQLHDMQQAVLWLRANAKARNLRADRIGIWGYSAGAHLAALLGVTGPGDKQFVPGARVQAVVAGGTPVDLRYYKDGPLPNGLMGVSYSQNPELWREASPVALVTPDDPPMVLYHGTFDFTVGAENAHAMYDALSAANVPAELYLYRGLEHLFTFFFSPVSRGVAFLDRYLR